MTDSDAGRGTRPVESAHERWWNSPFDQTFPTTDTTNASPLEKEQHDDEHR